jgi:hypothetical protein
LETKSNDSEAKAPDADQLIKVLEKNPWNCKPETFPMWREEGMSFLMRARHKQIWFVLRLFSMIKKSNAHSTMSRLEEQSRNLLWVHLVERIERHD